MGRHPRRLRALEGFEKRRNGQLGPSHPPSRKLRPRAGRTLLGGEGLLERPCLRRFRAWVLAVLLGELLAPSTSIEAAEPLPVGRIVERVVCQSDPTQSYALFVPSGWNPGRKWPILFAFDPGGRGPLAAERLREAAERHGWIVLSSNGVRSGAPWETMSRAVRALSPEPSLRGLEPDLDRIYLAGFSAGAMLSLLVALGDPRVAGVIASGGRLPDEIPRPNRVGFAWYGAAGDSDFNWSRMRDIDGLFESIGATKRFVTFEGGHRWLPKELVEDAVVWMEVVAMREGRAPCDEPFVERSLRRELDLLDALEAEGRDLEALRRAESASGAYEGLVPVGGLPLRIAALRGSGRAARALEEEKDAGEFEKQEERRFLRTLSTLVGGEEPMPASRVLSELGVDRLADEAKKPTWRGATARRLLERIGNHLSFVIPGEMATAKRYSIAVTALEAASKLTPDNAVIWYDLACMRARDGRESKALDALERAVELGFHESSLLASDPDLESLRGEERYRRLAERVAKPSAP